MDNKPYHLKDLISPLAEHSMKHADEFKDPTLGKEVLMNNVEDMKKHVIYTLFHPETKSFRGYDNRDCFYNAATNTIVIINPGKDQNGNILGGTAFRPKAQEQRFEDLLDKESRRLNTKIIPHEKGGIVVLRPEGAREFAKEYLQQKGKDVSIGQGLSQASQSGKIPTSQPIALEQKKQPVRQRTK